jgi:excisionase family DNA binding protein
METMAGKQSHRPRRYLRRGDVAEILGVSPNTISRWAREGRIPSIVTLGGHRRFPLDVVEKLAQPTADGQCLPDSDDDDSR